MYKKSITYTDYDGVERTEDFYFHLSKAELYEMELTTRNGYIKMIENIISSHDNKVIFENMKKIILASYGVKRTDGGFEKNPELTHAFTCSAAYSELLDELLSKPDEMANFANHIIPAELQNQGNAPNSSIPAPPLK